MSVLPLPVSLATGDRLDRQTYLGLYESEPNSIRAELISGVVFVAMPSRASHAVVHSAIATLLGMYANATHRVISAVEPTVLLGEDSAPEPDALLRVAGGTSHLDYEDYLVGPPELIVEISHASHAIDLHDKLSMYRQHGVAEYIVVSIRDREVFRFDFAGGDDLRCGEGIIRSIAFPGLWIDVEAALAPDGARLETVLRRGLASPEHAAFVQTLSAST